jgi:hypothetical protein
MGREWTADMAGERLAKRRADAAVERLAVGPRAVHTADAPAGRVWAWRRALGFRLVELGLRTALGAERC